MNQREIKFRVLDSGGWHYYTLNELLTGVYTTVEIDNGKAKAICEFTGLTDKNGKEIYEGDIVNDCSQHWDDHNTRLHDATGFVKYLDDIAVAEFQAVNDSNGIEVKNECYNGWFPLSNKVEVIGNIYENPELLKA